MNLQLINNPVRDHVYYVRNEGLWALQHWVKSRDEKRLQQAWDRFCTQLTDIIKDNFWHVAAPDTARAMKIELLDLAQQSMHAELLKQENHIISLDPCFKGHYNIGVSRYFQYGMENSSSTLRERPGSPILEEQMKLIPPDEYILLDDDIGTGNTIRKIMDMLPATVKIVQTVAMEKFHHQDNANVVPWDVADARDFLFGSHEGGLVLSLPNGKISRAPCILPYVLPSDRDKTAVSNNVKFSTAIWEMNHEFFATIKPTITLAEANPYLQNLMLYSGFKLTDTMQDLCHWHLDSQRVGSSVEKI